MRDLEERCRRFDQMGLEANSELQKVARRLKEENEALRNVLNRMGMGHVISQAMEEMQGKARAAPSSSSASGAGAAEAVSAEMMKKALSTDASALEYTLGGQGQLVGKVGGRQSKQQAKKEAAAQQAQEEAKLQQQQLANAIPQRKQSDAGSSMAAGSPTAALVDSTNRGQGAALPASLTQPSFNIPAVPGENVNPNMLHRSSSSQQRQWSAGGAAQEPNDVTDINMMPVAPSSSSSSSVTAASKPASSVNQILHLDLGARRQDAATLSIMDAVNKPPPNFHGSSTGEGAAGSSMLRNGNNSGGGGNNNHHGNAGFGRQSNMVSMDDRSDRSGGGTNKERSNSSSASSHPAISVATSQALGLDSSSKWFQPTASKLGGTPGSGMMGGTGGGGVNLFPLPQPTHTSDALLNPNPIPFAFNLNATTPADVQTWWQQLEMGGAILPRTQTEDGDDVLDEKAAMFAEAQRQKQIQLARESANGNASMYVGTPVASGSSQQPVSAQSPFDLNMFLNGAFTPGGGFSLNQASGSGSNAGDGAITPTLFSSQGGESSLLWAQQDNNAGGSSTPVQSGGAQPPPLLPQTEHAQIFLRLLEKKTAREDNMKDYERLGFRPPSMAQTGSSSGTSYPQQQQQNIAPVEHEYEPSRAFMKRKASSDDSILMPAPAQRTRKMTNSQSLSYLEGVGGGNGKGKAAETPNSAAAANAAGSIYSRLSQHPAFLSTNVDELEELVDAMGDHNLPGYGGAKKEQEQAQQAAQLQHPQQRSQSRASVDRDGASPGGLSMTSPSTQHSRRSSSSSSMRAVKEEPHDSMHGFHNSSTSSSSGGGGGNNDVSRGPSGNGEDGGEARPGGMERAFGYLDRKYASDAVAASVERRYRRSDSRSNDNGSRDSFSRSQDQQHQHMLPIS